MIYKVIYRDQVRKYILEQMHKGLLKPGATISLAGLSRELEISVTPIREALSQLQQSKIIKTVPNRGFIIPELSHAEAKDLYEMVAYLEAMAVENSKYNKKTIERLKKIIEEQKNATTDLSVESLDMKFHETLTKHFKNEFVQQILKDVRVRIFLFDLNYMKNQSASEKSIHDHAQIVTYIEKNDTLNAVNILKNNWLHVLQFINNQIKQN